MTLASFRSTRLARLRIASRHWAVVAGGGVLFALLVLGVFSSLLSTHDPSALAPARRAELPSSQHYFGTDVLGRDLFSRVIHGARVSLIVGVLVAVASCFFGTIIGLASGYLRIVDGIVMRTMDGLMSIPPILFAIALVTLTGGSVQNIVIAIVVAETPHVARLVRSVVLTLRTQPFVEGAITAGATTSQILWRHILPNTIGPLSVQASYIFGAAVIVEAALSFLGAGVSTTIPTWGNIMSEGRALWQVKPHIILFPAMFLSVTVLAVNLLGDSLRDALDPKLVRR